MAWAVVLLLLALVQTRGDVYNVFYNNDKNEDGGALYEVTPTGLLHIWAEAPYADIQAKVGDNITMAVFSLHNVVKFKTKAAFDSCTVADSSSFDVLTPVQLPPRLYTWSWKADSVGTKYLACTVDDHCALGMKVIVTVAAADVPANPRNHMLRITTPFWSFFSYPNVTITAGDTLRFKSNKLHNVAVYPNPADWAACATTGFNEFIDWDSETAAVVPKDYQFNNPGTYFLACTEFGHCEAGMKFVVTVLPPRTGSPERTVAYAFANRWLQGDPMITQLLAVGATAQAPNLSNLGFGAASTANAFLSQWQQTITINFGSIAFVTTNTNRFVLGLAGSAMRTFGQQSSSVNDVVVAELKDGYITKLQLLLDNAYSTL